MICKKCGKSVPDGLYCVLCGKKQATTPRNYRKRGNGMGSVVKLPGNRSKPFAVQTSVWADAAKTKRTRPYLGYFSTEAEANRFLLTLEGKDKGRFGFTLADVHAAYILKPSFLKKSADYKKHEATQWKWLSPLQDRKMRDLTTADYQDIITNMQDEGRASGTVEKVKFLAGRLCVWAMENDIIDRNYASFVEIEKTETTEKMIFTDEQIKVLFQHKADREAQIILALIFTGVRPSELFSVRKDERLHLNEGYFVNGSKTEAGKDRVIPILAPGMVCEWDGKQKETGEIE